MWVELRIVVVHDGPPRCTVWRAATKRRPPSPRTTRPSRKLNDQFVTAFKKGEFAALAALHTEDAILLPPGSTMIKGRSGVQAFWTQAGQGIGDIKLTTVDVKPLGPEAAREIGFFFLGGKGPERGEKGPEEGGGGEKGGG